MRSGTALFWRDKLFRRGLRREAAGAARERGFANDGKRRRDGLFRIPDHRPADAGDRHRCGHRRRSVVIAPIGAARGDVEQLALRKLRRRLDMEQSG
nr:hypothetical protein [Methylobrevis pamukkalensis]